MDGEAIKKEYVRSAISLTRLAQRHGLEPGALERRAKQENWQEARREFRREQAEKSLCSKRLERLLGVSDRLWIN